MNKVFCVGDLHGNYRGLKQALERSGFDYENDTLITLGDIVDGYSEVYECVEELLKIKNRIDIIGNHDAWFLNYINSGVHGSMWTQGGEGTLRSYLKSCLGDLGKMDRSRAYDGWITNMNSGDIPDSHKDFFRHQILYYVDDENRCFVHGGFNRHQPIKNQSPLVYMWDRDLWMAALSFKQMPEQKHPTTGKPYKFKIKDDFKEIFIGHTSTGNWKTDQPMNAANIWNLDTGSGYSGRVTVMNIDTHEYWQSDKADELYPDDFGRRK